MLALTRIIGTLAIVFIVATVAAQVALWRGWL